ncbi:SpvB/TcaC N-terminal domain-containing protein [Sandaracinus amylolyticus]|uniref:SpvB/TcaC N-terminal domain-containing protein n=1 Tax=Sandaracinus amylolyticus TaxID=927083 RepID=UPI0023DD6CA9|nr:SpvB/TcaC N-terminal domain-containing protein [Sandaracinus amylolyticus]
MGESFAPILSSGTATFSVPIAVAPGRRGVQPSLALSYSSTSGNGPVGFGWGLAAPFIARQSDRGLPRYVDDRQYHPQEDRFLYNGGQELVPVDSAAIAAVDQRAAQSGADASQVPDDVAGWQQYRARVEGAFMRFFRSPDSTRWVVQSRDGTRFDFGLLGSGEGPTDAVSASIRALEIDPESSEADPRVARWSLTRMSDAHGSTVYYGYRYDRGQSYLETIHYLAPHTCAGADVESTRECLEPLSAYGARVRLVYENREDVFSSFATGWKIETALRLRRVEITASSGVGRTLVRRYHLRYDPTSFHSLLSEVQVEGRPELANAELGVSKGRTDINESALDDRIQGRVLPPMRFGYSTMPARGEQIPGFGGVDATAHPVEHSPPHSVDEARADLFDVNSDGLPDLIVTDPARYRTREGEPAVGVFFNGFTGSSAAPAGATAHFSGAIPMPMDPRMSAVLSLSNPNVVPMDIDGDGRSDMLHMPRLRTYGWFTPTRGQDPASGAVVSPASQDWRWTYAQTELPADDFDPRVDLGRDAQHLEIVDVNNDHLIDIVRTTGTVMQTWVNLGWLPGGDGRFGSYRYVDDHWELSTQPIESCLLQSGTPVDFENAETRLADMNGDGLLDIVEIQRGRVRYWPGRGEGSWGEGPHECARGEGANRYIEMATPPAELNVELDGVSLTDVNADGATDVVQIRFDAVDVWFNRAGRAFTQRLIARGTPPTPSFVPRTRFADIDGSGTTDIVWGTANDWRYVDLAGGRRPRLLVRVENGLGAQTDIGYGSSAEDYVTDLAAAQRCTSCERFTWGRADGGHSARLEELAGTETWHSAGSPVISTVVRSVTTSDRLELLGREPHVSTTNFAYHDGYYEGIEQEFRGFGAADAQAVGDWNHPTSFTRTYFHQGRRPQSIADDRLADNPYEALKGREFLTETFDERGVYLSSAHATLTSRNLYQGLDGRWIQYAFVSEANELRYDTAVWAASAEELELTDVSFEAWGTTSWSQTSIVQRRARIRGQHFVRIKTTYDEVDSLGQVRRQTAHGAIDGAIPVDDVIVTHTTPVLRNPAEWIWRTGSTWITGTSDGVAQGPLRETINEYNDAGDVVLSRQVVGPLRAYTFGGDGSTEGPAIQQLQVNPSSTPGVSLDDDLVGSSLYDAWGNALASCVGADISELDPSTIAARPAGCLRYARVSYDADYAQLAETETTHVSTSGVTTLSTSGTWDRGLGAVLSATDPNGLVTSVTYDGLGRLVAVVPPRAEGCSDDRPTTRIAYELTGNAGAVPLSRVITTTELDCDAEYGEEGGSLVAISYIDGLGRARAGLSTGDAPGEWTRSGLSTLDAKGTVRRAYQPDVYVGSETSLAAVLALPRTVASPSGFPAFAEDDIPYTVTRHDAFGRTIGQHAEDGSYTSQSFHALSVDVCDALDNDSSSGFYGTCTTSRSDGHGRVTDQILRTYHADTGAPEQHRLWSYYRIDGVVTDLVRARSSAGVRPALTAVPSLADPHVHRVFHYDTLGRRIGTEDPDTDSRESGATAATRTWRYLFNRAGDLVAVRDPRGCGQNFFYDLGGRLLGEQYVSCSEAVSSRAEFGLYQLPIGSISMVEQTAIQRVDVRYWYDETPPTFITIPSRGGGMLGRMIGINDRGQRSLLAYDARGNAVWTARQVAVLPDAPALVAGPARTAPGDDRPSWTEAPIAANRVVTYATLRTYVRSARFDHAGRGTALVLPRDHTWTGTGLPPTIGGTLGFNRRGLPMHARVTIGCDPTTDANACQSHSGTRDVISEVQYARDGLVLGTTWGDTTTSTGATRAPSVSTTQYDVRRRPVRMITTRTPTGTEPRSLAAVSTVVDQQLVWDAASNLTEIIDHRDPTEWEPGHRPQSTYVMHDALYRVIGASFSYTQDSGTRTTADIATDWRDAQEIIRGDEDAENLRPSADPMHVEPAPMLQQLEHLPGRVQDLSWRWDWLGNTTSWNDDAEVFYERSIGAITNGVDQGGTSLRPSALYVSSDIPTHAMSTTEQQRAGWVELEYGVGGNVTSMTVHGQCRDAATQTCSDLSTTDPTARANHLRTHCRCESEQYYQYRWDELNRLAEARRWDRLAPATQWSLKVRQRYRYDGANVRVIKATIEPTSETDAGPPGALDERIALYVFPGDYEVRGLRRDASQYVARTGQYDHVETQYVVAGARMVWRHAADPELLDDARNRRMTVALTDVIQTTAARLDLLSGDLVEASTYYPNGARQTLLIDEEDPSATEPNGFTGKEADEEVGLTYFGERYLIGRAGRWTSPDPLHVHDAGGGESLNAYHYVAGNVFQARDPLGLDADDLCVSVGFMCNTGAPRAGDLTRSREAFEARPYVPQVGASGVTIGYGYDAGARTPAQVRQQFQAAGISPEQASTFATAAGLRRDTPRAQERQARDRERMGLSPVADGSPRTADAWLSAHPNGGGVQITREQAEALLQAEFARKHEMVRRVMLEGDTVTDRQYDALPLSIKELLTDLCYVGQPFSARSDELREMVHGWYNPEGADDLATEADMLDDMRGFIQALPEDLQGQGGRTERTAFIDERLREIRPAQPDSADASTSVTTQPAEAQ